MSTAKKAQPPPYTIPVEGQDSGVKIYHVHTPFDPHSIKMEPAPAIVQTKNPQPQVFVEPESNLGYESGTTTCTSCKEQVRTNVTYKVGRYAWLMCLIFILVGLFLCCCLIPFFMKRFKDAYHSCPKCNRVLRIEKRKFCE